jgi:hypothetical protein
MSTAGPPKPPADKRPQSGSPFGRFQLVGVLAVLVVALAVAVPLGLGGLQSGDEPDGSAKPTEPAATQSTPTTPRTLSGAEVRRVLARYAAAHTAHDLTGLRALFAPGFMRTINDQAPRGLRVSMADYARQFGAFPRSVYRLDLIDVKLSDGEATATAGYTIENAGPSPSTGVIAFHIRLVDGAPKIDAIAIRTH